MPLKRPSQPLSVEAGLHAIKVEVRRAKRWGRERGVQEENKTRSFPNRDARGPQTPSTPRKTQEGPRRKQRSTIVARTTAVQVSRTKGGKRRVRWFGAKCDAVTGLGVFTESSWGKKFFSLIDFRKEAHSRHRVTGRPARYARNDSRRRRTVELVARTSEAAYIPPRQRGGGKHYGRQALKPQKGTGGKKALRPFQTANGRGGQEKRAATTGASVGAVRQRGRRAPSTIGYCDTVTGFGVFTTSSWGRGFFL